MSSPADLQHYGWADTDEAPDGLALLYAKPIPTRPAAGLRVISPLPGLLTLAEAQDVATGLDDFAWGSELLQADQVGDWAVFVEPWGWAASTPEVVAAASTGGLAVGVFWNVNAVMQVVVAREGSVVREFDPLLYDGATLIPEEIGLPFGEPGSCRGAALLLAERLTAVRITREWIFARRRVTHRIALPPALVA